MWFENSYRRHLLDMHVNDWGDGVFLSRFDPDAYLENLISANVSSAMIYMQSHVGYCYYPTKTGHVHPALASRPDAMKKLVDGCRAHGIDTVAYYSIIYNDVESIAHPDWRMYGSEEEKWEFSGKRYLHCCPNSEGYLEFTLSQIGEILSYADFDGIFFDMAFWPKICRCENCVKRYEEEHGGAIPESEKAAGFREFAAVRDGWLNEYLEKIADFCRKIKPDISVQYNLASEALSGERMPTEDVAALCDFASGDIYRGPFAHSFACKLFSAITRTKPFECMTSRCPNLRAHTLTRSKDALRIALLTVCAHHGANFVIDAVDPVGTMDGRFYKLLGELYRETEKYEKYMKTGVPVADVGLFYCVEGKYSDAYYNTVLSAAKTLTNAHVPYGVVTQATVGGIDRFKTLVLPNAFKLSRSTVDALRDYVSRGGNVYFSGALDKDLLSLVAQPECVSTPGGYSYVAPEEGAEGYFEGFNDKYPLPVPYSLPIVKTENETLAHVVLPYHKEGSFASIHSDPPAEPTKYPAVVRRKLGRGTIVWSAAALEAEKSARVTYTFLKIINELCGGFSLTTDAPEQVETVAFSSERETLVSFIYQTDDETAPRVSEFETSVACPHSVARVENVTTGKELPFTYKDGRAAFSLPLPDAFAMVRLSEK